MTIKLYTAKASIGWVAHIALEESGLDYEAVALDLSANEQSSDDYLKINAKARVPSLIVKEGIITETPAILTYLADIAPESPLGLPDSAYEQSRINEFNLYLCSTVHVAHAHKLRGYRWVDDESALQAITANVPRTMTACADMIEERLLQTPWVHGERFTISDPYLYRVSTWLEPDGVNVDNYPKIRAHQAAMEERDSVKAVRAFFNV